MVVGGQIAIRPMMYIAITYDHRIIDGREAVQFLVTVKDCLKYQFKVEAAENPRDDHRINEGQEQLWTLMRRASHWVSAHVSRLSGGKIRLSDQHDRPRPALPRGGSILEGTEDGVDAGVELESRRR